MSKSPFTEAAVVSIKITKAYQIKGSIDVYPSLWQAQKAAMTQEFTSLLAKAWPQGVQVDHRVLESLAQGLMNRTKQVAGIIAIAHTEAEGE